MSSVNGKSFALILGVLIVVIWGTSFLCSKNLVLLGLQPHEAYFLRSFISYFCLVVISHHKLFANSLRDELFFLLLGVFGGSLYYVLENYALAYSLTTNVSLIVGISPLLTTLIIVFFFKLRLSFNLVFGAGLAVLGLYLLVFNGNFSYSIRVFGDFLALLASLTWAIYSVFLKLVSKEYDVLFISRKVFFYGLVTVLPFFIFNPVSFCLDDLLDVHLLFNLLYLALFSSFACFVGWIYVVRQIGPVNASNLDYLSPIFTFIASYLFLSEPITCYSIFGAVLILLGVFFAENDSNVN